MKPWTWLLVGLTSVVLVVFASAPAQWVAGAIESATRGKVQIADAQGSAWSGSGVIVLADGPGPDAQRVALPERLRWRVALLPLLAGQAAISLEHAAALARPLELRIPLAGGASHLGATTLRLPASLLTGLGAPFNTLRPGGLIELEWDGLVIDSQGVRGAWRADWRDASSRLTTVAPMGHYRLSGDGLVPGAKLQLATLAGPLELSGNGTIDDGGRLRFSGRAEPAPGTDPAIRTQLGGLISMLGQRSGNGAQLSIGS